MTSGADYARCLPASRRFREAAIHPSAFDGGRMSKVDAIGQHITVTIKVLECDFSEQVRP